MGKKSLIRVTKIYFEIIVFEEILSRNWICSIVDHRHSRWIVYSYCSNIHKTYLIRVTDWSPWKSWNEIKVEKTMGSFEKGASIIINIYDVMPDGCYYFEFSDYIYQPKIFCLYNFSWWQSSAITSIRYYRLIKECLPHTKFWHAVNRQRLYTPG